MSQRRWAMAFLVVAGVLLANARPSAAQEANHRGVRFLLAVDQGDLDAALAMVIDQPELVDAEGGVHLGQDEIRAYLEVFPRPIVIVETRPSAPGSRLFQTPITAAGTPLLVTFAGGGGRIARIVIEPMETDEAP